MELITALWAMFRVFLGAAWAMLGLYFLFASLYAAKDRSKMTVMPPIDMVLSVLFTWLAVVCLRGS